MAVPCLPERFSIGPEDFEIALLRFGLGKAVKTEEFVAGAFVAVEGWSFLRSVACGAIKREQVFENRSVFRMRNSDPFQLSVAVDVGHTRLIAFGVFADRFQNAVAGLIRAFDRNAQEVTTAIALPHIAKKNAIKLGTRQDMFITKMISGQLLESHDHVAAVSRSQT